MTAQPDNIPFVDVFVRRESLEDDLYEVVRLLFPDVRREEWLFEELQGTFRKFGSFQWSAIIISNNRFGTFDWPLSLSIETGGYVNSIYRLTDLRVSAKRKSIVLKTFDLKFNLAGFRRLYVRAEVKATKRENGTSNELDREAAKANSENEEVRSGIFSRRAGSYWLRIAILLKNKI